MASNLINNYKKRVRFMLISYSRKELRSVGNYENVTFEVMAQDNVDYEHESNDDCYNRLKLFVDANISESFRSYRRPSTKHVDLEYEAQEIKTIGKAVDGNTIDGIRANIAVLMSYDANMQYTIADMLKTFEADKLTSLKDDQLKHFNDNLKEIIKDCAKKSNNISVTNNKMNC